MSMLLVLVSSHGHELYKVDVCPEGTWKPVLDAYAAEHGVSQADLSLWVADQQVFPSDPVGAITKGEVGFVLAYAETKAPAWR